MRFSGSARNTQMPPEEDVQGLPDLLQFTMENLLASTSRWAVFASSHGRIAGWNGNDANR